MYFPKGAVSSCLQTLLPTSIPYTHRHTHTSLACTVDVFTKGNSLIPVPVCWQHQYVLQYLNPRPRRTVTPKNQETSRHPESCLFQSLKGQAFQITLLYNYTWCPQSASSKAAVTDKGRQQSTCEITDTEGEGEEAERVHMAVGFCIGTPLLWRHCNNSLRAVSTQQRD